MAKKKAKKEEEEFWTEELVEDEDELEELDIKKLKFSKIKDLEIGMENINVEATIDFVGDTYGTGYGEDPYAIAFLKDRTGEIKVTFWGDDIKKAKPKKKVRILQASVSDFRGQLQINPNRRRGIEFL
jgi:ssDNA-binding replication factor A large subunit